MSLKITSSEKKEEKVNSQITHENIKTENIRFDKSFISEKAWYIQSRPSLTDDESLILSVLEYPIDPSCVKGVDIFNVPSKFDYHKLLDGQKTVNLLDELLSEPNAQIDIEIDTIRKPVKKLIFKSVEDDEEEIDLEKE